MKTKIIIIIMSIMALLISMKVQALELGKPTQTDGFILDNENVTTGVWLSNTNINILKFISEGPEKEERYWQIYTYNNNTRLKYMQIIYNTFAIINNTENILEFKIAYNTTIHADTYSTLIKSISILYEDNTWENNCGITTWGGSDDIGKDTAVNKVKCIVNKTPKLIWIEWEKIYDDYVQNNYYISEIIKQKTQTTEEELLQTQQEIKEGQEIMQQYIENAFQADISENAKTLDPRMGLIGNLAQLESQVEIQGNTGILNVNQDQSTYEYIWGKITQYKESNATLSAFIISALSLGIIKLLLGG